MVVLFCNIDINITFLPKGIPPSRFFLGSAYTLEYKSGIILAYKVFYKRLSLKLYLIYCIILFHGFFLFLTVFLPISSYFMIFFIVLTSKNIII